MYPILHNSAAYCEGGLHHVHWCKFYWCSFCVCVLPFSWKRVFGQEKTTALVMENVYLIIIIIRAFVRRTMSASQLNLRHLDSLSLSLHFNGHFPGEPGLAGSYWSKGWRKCWWQLDYWSYKSCKAPVKWSQPTNQQPVFFYRSDALPVTQPTVSKHWREKYHIPWTCLPQAHLGVFQLCLWPLIAPGNLWWQQQVGVLSSSVYQQWVDVCCSWGYRKSGFRWTCPVFWAFVWLVFTNLRFVQVFCPWCNTVRLQSTCTHLLTHAR